ncbi:MAG: FAD-binding oxidoreductase [Candidatus Liptonbacteria bacterium]|nr:FAD-binding oxidoreductase [Candidatus Liptonbacteria bacterium]
MLADELRKIIKGDAEADDTTLEKYSRDFSIFKVVPEVVVFPRDTEDVKALVKFASAARKRGRKISLTGRAAGTDMTGGPLTESVVVDFTRHMNRIKEIGKDYVVVEPGVYYRDLEPELARRGLMYPAYPASKDYCAIGGMVMNNAGGEKTLLYGKTEQYVAQIKMVLADGEEHVIKPMSRGALEECAGKRDFECAAWRKLRRMLERRANAIAAARPDTSKNSSGYSLWNVWDGNTFDPVKLFVGSQGTLGLMTEVKLRLVPKPAHTQLVVLFLRDIERIGDLVNEILKVKPESIESYDDKTLGVVLRYLPSFIWSMKGDFLKLAWSFLPEVGMMLRGGVPKMILLVSLTADTEQELHARTIKLVHMVRREFRLPVRAVRDKAEEEKYWTIRRQSFALLHGHIKDRDTAPFIDDIAVQPRHLPEFLPKLNAILERYKDKLIYTIAGHPGDGNFHIIPLMDLKNPKVRALIPAISDEVYALVLRYRGSITAEHNDGIIRTPYVKEMYGREVYALFEEVKHTFDPQGVFNPGKKVRGTLKYALEHIRSNRE